jgi:hypothetical protein
MRNQWYWEHKGELYGPLSDAEVESLIHSSRIKAADRIKLGENGEWLGGLEIISHLSPAKHLTDSSSTSADRVLQQLRKSQFNLAAQGGESNHSFVDGIRQFLSRMFHFWEFLQRRLADGVGFFLQTSKGRLSLIALCVVIGTFAVIGRIDWGTLSAQRTHAELARINEECLYLHTQNAKAAEWQKLADETRPILDRLQNDLEQTFKMGDGIRGSILRSHEEEYRVKVMLYHTCRYHLPEVIESNVRGDISNVKRLELASKALDSSQKLLEKGERASIFGEINWKVIGHNIGIPWNWMSVDGVIIVLDVLFVLLIFWVGRKSISPKAFRNG